MSKKEKNRKLCLHGESLTEDETPKDGTIYDDVFRTMIDKLPHLVIPLVNEVFSRRYSDSETSEWTYGGYGWKGDYRFLSEDCGQVLSYGVPEQSGWDHGNSYDGV